MKEKSAYYEVFVCLNKENFINERIEINKILRNFYIKNFEQTFLVSIDECEKFYGTNNDNIIIHLTKNKEMAKFFSRQILSKGIYSYYIKR